MVWTPPRTWPAGEEPTSAILNAHIRDNFKAIGDPWTAWTPVMTGTTNPTYTASGGYLQAGGLVIGWFEFSMTTAGTGNYAVTLPVAAAAHWFPKPFGLVSVQNGTAFYSRMSVSTGGTTSFAMTGDAGTRVSATSPVAVVSGVVISGSFLYEAA